jgi:hypothetical protein
MNGQMANLGGSSLKPIDSRYFQLVLFPLTVTLKMKTDFDSGEIGWHSLFNLCKICGFYGGDYEEWRLLGCYAVWLL